jgi:plasmid stabilization system protein ParE
MEEHDAAIGHYADIDPVLGSACRQALVEGRTALQENPKLFAMEETTGTREYIVRRYPYSFHYLELDECSWIVAVAHHKRKPFYWKRRLSQIRGMN